MGLLEESSSFWGRIQAPACDWTISLDFCTPSEKLIIELDGSQHLVESSYEDERTRFLLEKGYRILRFWNHEITNEIDSVILAISHAIQDRS